MTRIEKTQKISACAETLFNVLKDYEHYALWNPMILHSEENGKGFILKTLTGEENVHTGERIPFAKISHIHENNPFIMEAGETFSIAANCRDTNVTFYAIPRDGNISDEIRRETEIKLKSLKHYAEYIENGGNPEQYSKLQIV
ncbi:MAG: hypothetical protein JW776_11670 [Candidatus Lokiarchaeota archaeon]|nr:hypothetical protein [Candidatus Lokiarchaeota archaeon]